MNMDGTPIYRYLVADYLDIGSGEEPDYQVMRTFENIDESPNAQTTEKHYTANKSASVITTGYQTQFPITADMYQNDRVMEYLRDVAEEQRLGQQTNYVRVRLYQPVQGQENTFYARRFRVDIEISTISGGGGEIMSLDGNLNAQSDAEIGEFNTQTRSFTPKTEITA